MVLQSSAQSLKTEVLVIGGGTGGTAAGIQSARSGAHTIIAEPTTWLGGMLSAAGVSATDGNHKLYSGIWQEFREALYTHYSTRNLMTGWVSNTLFEPHVADSIFKAWAAKEKLLQVKLHYGFVHVIKKGNHINGAVFINDKGDSVTILAKVIIDATELGDVMDDAGVPYDIGMEAGSVTGENVGVTQTNHIIQDLTYVAILKDFGKNADKTISKPENYDSEEFDGACTSYYHNTTIEKPTVNAQRMLDYGKLPHGKYMINWPQRGNDTYLDIIAMTGTQREHALAKAKQTTLRFVYFIQHELGFKYLGLADDEYATPDRLPYIPYYREGRRVKGLVRYTIRNISEPFTYGYPLYRTGISVGDYPIDQHHKKNPLAPQHLDFYSIPSFNVPLGALIPIHSDNLIIAEKGISVSNVVNGTTRLQPCVLLTGQAAGVLAAQSIKQHCSPDLVNIRAVQQELLNHNAYIMPYIDVKPDMSSFASIQRIGATGILKGRGRSFQWANQTWFYPDSLCRMTDLQKGLEEYAKGWSINFRVPKHNYITVVDLSVCFSTIRLPQNDKHQGDKSDNVLTYIKSHWGKWMLDRFEKNRSLTRAEVAVVLDKVLNPFEIRKINFKGQFLSNNK